MTFAAANFFCLLNYSAYFPIALFREEGEDCSALPYVRLSKKPHHRALVAQMTEADMLETMAIREVSPDRLLATKRIVTAFNAGDIDEIREIVFDASLDVCDVHFSNIQHAFVGKAALFSLWTALFEAFPNGIFRTSDSVINEKKRVYTSFLFFGTKIFPLLIDGTSMEIVANNNSNNNTNNNKAASSSSSTSLSSSSTRGALSSSGQQAMPSSSRASVVVDRERPMFTTAELLEAEHIPEMVFEGRIVLHLNESCKIRKFDFSWNRKY